MSRSSKIVLFLVGLMLSIAIGMNALNGRYQLVNGYYQTVNKKGARILSNKALLLLDTFTGRVEEFTVVQSD
ncbi:MAG: hypothetical protein ISS47_10300 [Candidatus Omnitrophica bacterium]|nr:hypothetical protein [Candidatus Omnitrophota bacterium]